jgi:hypothetical protein
MLIQRWIPVVLKEKMIDLEPATGPLLVAAWEMLRQLVAAAVEGRIGIAPVGTPEADSADSAGQR